MKKILAIILCGVLLTTITACGGKKKSDDIIAPKIVKAEPKAPIRMPEYTDTKEIGWIGKTYIVNINRRPADSLEMVNDENGQKFVDNIFILAVKRQDGSVFFTHEFNKGNLSSYLDDDYRKTGVLEGLVFDKVDGDWLVFGASVGHPQTDEYIPLVIRLSRMGVLEIKRDSQMDTENMPTSSDVGNEGV